jgi:hypothetical protein
LKSNSGDHQSISTPKKSIKPFEIRFDFDLDNSNPNELLKHIHKKSFSKKSSEKEKNRKDDKIKDGKK